MIKLYDTRRRQKVDFEPVEPGKVSMYVCGPTVYNRIHIGNARTFISFDMIRRYLSWRGFDVTFVQNVTDVDDKIIRRAAEEARTAAEVAEEYTRLFIGPGELPCQPMESPYRTKDAAVFQENTLAVRAIFREHGLQLARLMRIPDDQSPPCAALWLTRPSALSPSCARGTWMPWPHPCAGRRPSCATICSPGWTISPAARAARRRRCSIRR